MRRIFYYQIVVEYSRTIGGQWFRYTEGFTSDTPSWMPEMSRRHGRTTASRPFAYPGNRRCGQATTHMGTGYDPHGRYIEMVGVPLADGVWLIYHAMTPPSKKTLKEIESARRRGY